MPAIPCGVARAAGLARDGLWGEGGSEPVNVSSPAATASERRRGTIWNWLLPVMTAACVAPLPLYRPRDPQASDLWRLLDQHFETFQQVYDERFQTNCPSWTWSSCRPPGKKPCSRRTWRRTRSSRKWSRTCGLAAQRPQC